MNLVSLTAPQDTKPTVFTLKPRLAAFAHTFQPVTERAYIQYIPLYNALHTGLVTAVDLHSVVLNVEIIYNLNLVGNEQLS